MKTKTVKIALEGFGSYLGMEKGCFIVKKEKATHRNVHCLKLKLVKSRSKVEI